MGTTYKLLNDVIVPNFQSDRIIVAINQADRAMSGRNWDYDNNKPHTKLKNFLEEQSHSIKNRILESTGINITTPIYYSAEYNYNIDKLMDALISKIPHTKRDL